jgi:hypothetical protein
MASARHRAPGLGVSSGRSRSRVLSQNHDCWRQAGHSPAPHGFLQWEPSSRRRRWPICCVCSSATRRLSFPCPATGMSAGGADGTSAWRDRRGAVPTGPPERRRAQIGEPLVGSPAECEQQQTPGVIAATSSSTISQGRTVAAVERKNSVFVRRLPNAMSGMVIHRERVVPSSRRSSPSLVARSCIEADLLAPYSCRLGGLPRRRCPSADDAGFPFRLRRSSTFRTATKPSPSTVSTDKPRPVTARLMAVRIPGCPAPPRAAPAPAGRIPPRQGG